MEYGQGICDLLLMIFQQPGLKDACYMMWAYSRLKE